MSMRRAILLFVAVSLGRVAAAQETAAVVQWTAADLKAQEGKLVASLGEKTSASQQLVSTDGHSATLSHRLNSGEAEIHDGVTDIFYIQGGSGSFVTGGTVSGARTPRPGEVRGPSIEGGASRKLAVGDVVVIPPKTPHQIVLAPGEKITYLVAKVRSREKEKQP